MKTIHKLSVWMNNFFFCLFVTPEKREKTLSRAQKTWLWIFFSFCQDESDLWTKWMVHWAGRQKFLNLHFFSLCLMTIGWFNSFVDNTWFCVPLFGFHKIDKQICELSITVTIRHLCFSGISWIMQFYLFLFSATKAICLLCTIRCVIGRSIDSISFRPNRNFSKSKTHVKLDQITDFHRFVLVFCLSYALWNEFFFCSTWLNSCCYFIRIKWIHNCLHNIYFFQIIILSTGTICNGDNRPNFFLQFIVQKLLILTNNSHSKLLLFLLVAYSAFIYLLCAHSNWIFAVNIAYKFTRFFFSISRSKRNYEKKNKIIESRWNTNLVGFKLFLNGPVVWSSTTQILIHTHVYKRIVYGVLFGLFTREMLSHSLGS